MCFKKINKISNWQWLTLIAILAIGVRAVFFFAIVPYNPIAQDRDEYLEIARNLVAGEGFSLIREETNALVPTAKRGPTISYFFATVILLLGDHTLSIAFANWMLDAVTSIILCLIALEIFSDRRIALTAACLYVFYFPEIYYAWQALSEPLATALTALFVYGFLRALQSPSLINFVVTGFFLAFATLTRPIMLYFLPIAIIILIWLFHRQGKTWFRWAVVLALSFVVLLLPWTIRNYLVFEQSILVNSNTGVTMYHGNYALGDPDWLKVQWHYEGGADLDEKIPPEVQATMTQPQRDQFAMAESLKIIRQHPIRYLVLSTIRVFRMWYFIQGTRSFLKPLVLIYHIALLMLALCTWILYRDGWWRYGMILVILILFYNVGNAAIRTNVRYIIPIVPYVMLFAAVSIVPILVNLKGYLFKSDESSR